MREQKATAIQRRHSRCRRYKAKHIYSNVLVVEWKKNANERTSREREWEGDCTHIGIAITTSHTNMVWILFVIGINANDFLLLLLKVLLTAIATGAAAAFGMTRRVHISFLATYFVNMHRAFIVLNHKGIYVVMYSTDCIVTDSLSFFRFCF